MEDCLFFGTAEGGALPIPGCRGRRSMCADQMGWGIGLDLLDGSAVCCGRVARGAGARPPGGCTGVGLNGPNGAGCRRQIASGAWIRAVRSVCQASVAEFSVTTEGRVRKPEASSFGFVRLSDGR